MTKSSLVPMGLLSALAVAAAGCAHQPPMPASMSGELNVMQVANEMGYTTPKVVNGQTLYCQNEELTGSLVPKTACINADEVEINRSMVRQAKRKIAVADHRKLGVVTKWLICPTNAIDLLITDKGASDKMIAPFLEQKVKIRRV